MDYLYRRRYYILTAGFVLTLLLILRSYVLAFILEPIALVVWAVWRVLLSVDQTVWWGLLILAIFLLAVRLLPNESQIYPSPKSYSRAIHGNSEERLAFWSSRIWDSSRKESEREAFRQDLIELITVAVSLKEKLERSQARQALREKQIPMPESAHAFLFPREYRKENPSRLTMTKPLRLFHRFIEWPERVNRSKYQRDLAEVIQWMETILEMDHYERRYRTDID